MIRMDTVNQYYGQSHTLWDLSMEVPAGTCTALIGRNGVGKTTLLKCLMGLLPVRSGRMLFEDSDLLKLPAERRASIGIGYVPQGRMVFPLMTVQENLQTGLGALPAAKRRIPDLVWELFPVLHDMLTRRGGDLSGGQQQRLCIARAIAVEPEVLLMDEPCSALDPISTLAIEDLIHDLKNQYTIIIVTHNMQQAARVSDETAFFNLESVGEPGRLIEVGSTTDIFSQPKHQQTEDYISGRFG